LLFFASGHPPRFPAYPEVAGLKKAPFCRFFFYGRLAAQRRFFGRAGKKNKKKNKNRFLSARPPKRKKPCPACNQKKNFSGLRRAFQKISFFFLFQKKKEKKKKEKKD